MPDQAMRRLIFHGLEKAGLKTADAAPGRRID
jgi:hypothetical protein